MRFTAALIALFLVALATSPVSAACQVSFFPIPVRSDFQVKVSDYAGPVQGILLNLTGPPDGVRSALTDGNGIARFENIPRGTHYLRADHDNSYGLQLNVKPKGPRNVIVPMGWPSVEPIQVRAIFGTMRAPDAVSGRLEQPVLSLELLEGISGRILASLNTTDRVEFDFGPQVAGVYFIHLKPYTAFSSHEQAEGLISVAVNPAAPDANHLDLDLRWTSCGLMYTDQLQCPRPELHLNQLRGHVSYSTGRAIFGVAEILLVDAAQSQVAHVSADASGNFSVPGPLAGTFQLRVEVAGFNPVHTPIHIEPTAGSSSLEIEAAFGGGCSTVRAK